MQDTKKATSYPDNQARREYGDFAGKWEFGSNPSAELWNGRLAMIGFAAAVIIELTSGQGLLHFWGLI